MTLLSWNVNGIRAIEKKGFLAWLIKTSPDLLAVQETKAQKEQLSLDLVSPPGYETYWCSAEKKGYSGVSLFTRHKPLSLIKGMGNPVFDREGRVLVLEFRSFFLADVYFPNGKMNRQRLEFKLDFYDEFLAFYLRIRKKHKRKAFILCGDLNTAHKDIDLARPEENINVSGFLPEERACIDRFIRAGLVDTFRLFNQQGGNYTWWDLRTRSRERNTGWRIDYFFIDREHISSVSNAFILDQVMGSDHCPCGVDLDL